MSSVFVAGTSVLSCGGCDITEFCNNLYNNRADLDINLPLMIPNVIDKNIIRRMDRFSNLALTVSKMAIENSRLDIKSIEPYKIGTVFSSSYGPLNRNLSFGYKLEEYGPLAVSPIIFSGTVFNACVGHICINFGFKGVSTMIIGNNIGYSFDLLKHNKADVILTGGIEEYCPELYECYTQMDYFSKDENILCRPLDKNRNGTKFTEGAAALILTGENESIKENILCEIIGYGNSTAYEIPSRARAVIDSSPFCISMYSAIDDSNLTYDMIDAIFMAADGSIYGDLSEANAIHEIFKEKADKIPVTSIKGLTGETMGASLSINTSIAAISLKEQSIPPTVGFSEYDPQIDLNVVCGKSLKGEYKHILVNSFDATGSVSSIILKYYK